MKIRQEVIGEMKDLGIAVTEDQIDKLTEERLRREITKGIQTIQYQVVTLLTTNGQAPFVTVYMYLDRGKEPAGEERPCDDHRGDLKTEISRR